MKSVNPYFDFGGRCREALEFYKECFGGEIIELVTYAETPLEVPEQFKQQIMHAKFRAEDIYFMATDGDPPASHR